ncbi:group 3 secretory phospholipase A2 [Trichomycterus rosablanca]|uniref:group 3 secretory phospholipase A2 n=1 Tax=Trichomycterus rosablanca TaxID=2290929 RepID=UPI002F34FB66
MKVGVYWIICAHFAIALFYSTASLLHTRQHELFCFRTVSALGRTQCSFLRKTASNESFLFYWTVWTDDRHMEECSVSSDQGLVRDYMSLCGEQEGTMDLYTASFQLNVSLILEPGGPCTFRPSDFGNFRMRNYGSNRRSPVQLGVKKRQKRAWIFPGTLWCGHGSSADEYEQLGMFERVDSCCREHDHCDHIIRPFTVNFGIFNPTLFTISHCDCDRRFKQCLLDVNDTVSNMVGYSFFNILKQRCFDLIQKKRCTQMNWFGMCTSAQVGPLAVFRNQAAYNATGSESSIPNVPGHPTKPKNKKPKPRKPSDPQTSYALVAPVGRPEYVSPGRTGKTDGKIKTLLTTSYTTRPDCRQMKNRTSGPTSIRKSPKPEKKSKPTRVTKIRQSRTFPLPPEVNDKPKFNTTSFSKKDKRVRTSSVRKKKKKIKTSVNENASVKRKTIDVEKTLTTTSRSRTKVRKMTDLKRNVETSKFPSVCDVARHLDDCRYRVRPAERVYGHHNTGSTTIYHCDCIHRLTDHIKKWKNPSILKLVLKSVSTSCIEDADPKDCRKTTGCPAVLSKAKMLESLLMKTEEGRDTAKYRKMTANKAVPDQLYKHCVKIFRSSKHVRKSPSKHL